MRITIFGGTLPKPGEPDYQEAVRLGQLLARSGHSVITGGYMGTMEAASRGAAEAGGHVIGVTCTEIERWRSSKANPWVREEWKYATLQERMVAMTDACDAVIVLPGGVGTLAEITLMWNRMVIQAIQPRPLIMIGPRWEAAFTALFAAEEDYIPTNYRALLQFIPTVEEAVKLVNHLHL